MASFWVISAQNIPLLKGVYTVCPKGLDPFHIVGYFIEWVNLIFFHKFGENIKRAKKEEKGKISLFFYKSIQRLILNDNKETMNNKIGLHTLHFPFFGSPFFPSVVDFTVTPPPLSAFFPLPKFQGYILCISFNPPPPSPCLILP